MMSLKRIYCYAREESILRDIFKDIFTRRSELFQWSFQPRRLGVMEGLVFGDSARGHRLSRKAGVWASAFSQIENDNEDSKASQNLHTKNSIGEDLIEVPYSRFVCFRIRFLSRPLLRLYFTRLGALNFDACGGFTMAFR